MSLLSLVMTMCGCLCVLSRLAGECVCVCESNSVPKSFNEFEILSSSLRGGLGRTKKSS